MPTYEEVFLSRADAAKYQEYALLSRTATKALTLKDLAELIGWKYQVTYNVFQELLDDLQTLSDQPREAVRSALFDAGPLPVSLDRYRSYLARQGLMYQAVDYACRATAPSADKFVTDHYISKTTLARQLKPVNELLATYGVRLAPSSLTFTGGEDNIRYCLYTFYWWAHRGAFWPFEATSQKAMRALGQSISLVATTELMAIQNDYFLGVSLTRVGKRHLLPEIPMLDQLSARIKAFGVTQCPAGSQVPVRTVAFFHFFQLSRPRFDWRERGDAAIDREIAFLGDPVCKRVSTGFCELIKNRAPDPVPIPPDLVANCLRLVFGYTLFGGEVPIPDDYVDGTRRFGYDPKVRDDCLAFIAYLPDRPEYAAFKRGKDDLALQVATLAVPYLRYQDHGDRLLVEVCVDPEAPGFDQLCEFLNVVPWTAEKVARNGDLVIVDGVAPQSLNVRIHPERCFPWWPNALSQSAYRRGLVTHILALHDEKFGKAPEVVKR